MMYPITLVSIFEVLFAIIPVLLTVAFVTVAERKSMASMQRRLGPNVVGYYGLLQAFADALKLILKEYISPTQANIVLFFIGPVITLVFSLLGYAVVPYGPGLTIWDFNLGILYMLAVSSLATYGILLAGWSANSKYAFLGSLRSTAQLISYELILSSGILLVILLTGSLSLTVNIETQKVIWLALPLFPVFVTFFIGSVAETNRAPFDLAEAESELVSGFMTEHAAVIFVFFFLAEYASIALICILNTMLYFGGYLFDLAQTLNILNEIAFIWDPGYFISSTEEIVSGLTIGIKSCIIVFMFILIRASYPRIRFDQLMSFSWTRLLPVLVALIILAPCYIYLLDLITNHWSLFFFMPLAINRQRGRTSNVMNIKRFYRHSSNNSPQKDSNRLINLIGIGGLIFFSISGKKLFHAVFIPYLNKMNMSWILVTGFVLYLAVAACLAILVATVIKLIKEERFMTDREIAKCSMITIFISICIEGIKFCTSSLTILTSAGIIGYWFYIYDKTWLGLEEKAGSMIYLSSNSGEGNTTRENPSEESNASRGSSAQSGHPTTNWSSGLTRISTVAGPLDIPTSNLPSFDVRMNRMMELFTAVTPVDGNIFTHEQYQIFNETYANLAFQYYNYINKFIDRRGVSSAMLELIRAKNNFEATQRNIISQATRDNILPNNSTTQREGMILQEIARLKEGAKMDEKANDVLNVPYLPFTSIFWVMFAISGEQIDAARNRSLNIISAAQTNDTRERVENIISLAQRNISTERSSGSFSRSNTPELTSGETIDSSSNSDNH